MEGQAFGDLRCRLRLPSTTEIMCRGRDRLFIVTDEFILLLREK